MNTIYKKKDAVFSIGIIETLAHQCMAVHFPLYGRHPHFWYFIVVSELRIVLFMCF